MSKTHRFLHRDSQTHERVGYSTDGTNRALVGDDGVPRSYPRGSTYIDARCPEDRAALDAWVAQNR